MGSALQCGDLRRRKNREKTRSMDFVRYLLFWHCLLVLTFSQRLDSPNGILIIGGNSGFALNYKSVEFWSPSDPDEESCSLYDYPRGIKYGPTANLVSSQVVVCYDESCEIFNGGEWSRLTTTRSRRLWHSSAVQDDERILLIGGKYSNSSTEWISVDGSPSQPGPFDVRHGSSHCTIQLSSNVIVLTGGIRTRNLVTRYKMTGNGDETPLTSMNRGRDSHACGVYRDASGQQVRRLSINLILMIMMIFKMTDHCDERHLHHQGWRIQIDKNSH